MNLLFSFLEAEHPHSTLLAGYFSKVLLCWTFRFIFCMDRMVLVSLCACSYIFYLSSFSLHFPFCVKEIINDIFSRAICALISYFQVVICLFLRKTVPFMRYIQVSELFLHKIFSLVTFNNYREMAITSNKFIHYLYMLVEILWKQKTHLKPVLMYRKVFLSGASVFCLFILINCSPIPLVLVY